MADEAAAFAAALRRQGELRVGTLYDRTQVLFAYHLNRIVGGRLTRQQTR